MKKNISLNYQFSIFGEFSDITPENSGITIKLMKKFDGEKFIPNIFQELSMNTMPPKIDNRISLINTDGWTISIGNERIDVSVDYNDDGAYKDMQLDEIELKAVKMLESIMEIFGKTCKRIALNTTELLDDVKSQKIIEKYLSRGRLLNYYDSNIPYEWNERYVANVECTDINEKINVITNITKSQGKLSNNNTGKTIDFDGIMIQFDINTLPNNVNYRFSHSDIKHFFKKAVLAKKEIEKNI